MNIQAVAGNYLLVSNRTAGIKRTSKIDPSCGYSGYLECSESLMFAILRVAVGIKNCLNIDLSEER